MSGFRHPVKFSDKSGAILDIFKVPVTSIRRFLKSLPEGKGDEKKNDKWEEARDTCGRGVRSEELKEERRALTKKNGKGSWEDTG